jgi:hypothetical protein
LRSISSNEIYSLRSLAGSVTGPATAFSDEGGYGGVMEPDAAETEETEDIVYKKEKESKV